MFVKKRQYAPYKSVYLNRLHKTSALIFIIIIIIFGLCTSFFISIPERSRLLQKSHDAAMEISFFMRNKSTDFWKTYIPVFHDGKLTPAISDFFEGNPDNLKKNPEARQQLVNTLTEMTASSTDICWLLLYREADNSAYLYFKNSGIFSKAPSDFPFLNLLGNSPSTHFLANSKIVSVPLVLDYPTRNKRTYAMIGNIFSSFSDSYLGNIIVGFDTASLHSIYTKYQFDIPTDIFVTTSAGEIIYTSTGDYSENIDPKVLTHTSGDIFSFDKTSYYLETVDSYKQQYHVFSRIPQSELQKASHKYDPVIWMICLALSALSAGLYLFTGWLSARKTNIILDGVREISKNNLSYRIPVNRSVDEFSTIASNINHMAEQIQDYIQKSYLYSLKQKNAELGELQSKFNPHFLYNTLSVIHSQLLQNVDEECADMVLLLSQIFRNFISQKQFVSIREELSLSKLYMQLFEIRYADEFEIIFDVDSAILEYSIIRNLTQPVIENYFVHGFTSQNICNQITISGHLTGEDYISLEISDTGTGIRPERLLEIQTSLSSAISEKDGSYGLKNINDRIKTFYGDDCGLSIESVFGQGTTITLLIKKMTNEQHVNRFQYQENAKDYK